MKLNHVTTIMLLVGLTLYITGSPVIGPEINYGLTKEVPQHVEHGLSTAQAIGLFASWLAIFDKIARAIRWLFNWIDRRQDNLHLKFK